MDTIQTQQFIENSRHALDHLFKAFDEYNKVLITAQKEVEEIDCSKKMLSDLFMYRDQWSPNANHHYAQYVQRMKQNLKQNNAEEDFSINLNVALTNIDAIVESMSSLAGIVLQIAKQTLSLRYTGKPTIPGARLIGQQSIVEIIWDGRNHSLHWDEGEPRVREKAMLNNLSKNLDITIIIESNNCLSILGVLGWTSTDNVIKDLNALI